MLQVDDFVRKRPCAENPSRLSSCFFLNARDPQFSTFHWRESFDHVMPSYMQVSCAGDIFAIDDKDWKFLFDEVPVRLRRLASEGQCYCINSWKKFDAVVCVLVGYLF